MTWLSFFTALFQLLNAAFAWAHEKNLIDAGGVAAFQKILQGQADDLKKKLAAIDAAGKRFDDDVSRGVQPPVKYRD
jgi:hypothetical protein